MPSNTHVASISAFFPCYNDAPTIALMVRTVSAALAKVVDDYEVIVVNDGSADESLTVLHELAEELPLRIVDHGVNRGYGAALISGFEASTKEWVFYTDGDAQYDAAELDLLVAAVTGDVDIAQGVKIGRGDPLHRRLLGRAYHHVVKLAFRLPVRDTDCDFRLIRRTMLDKIELTSTSGVICVELMHDLDRAGARFVEVPVHHYHRPHGRSQFFRLPQLWRAATGIAKLWWKIGRYRV